MTRTIEKGFFKDYFIDLIEPMYEEVDKWLDEYEGSFTTYVYFYENGKVEIVIEYPYDYDGENGADLVFELDGDGVAEMKDIMKSEIDFDEFN